MDTNQDKLIFITYLDEGWCVTAPNEPSEEEDGGIVNPPVPTFSEALKVATDLADMFPGATVILPRGAAKIALREMRRQRKAQL